MMTLQEMANDIVSTVGQFDAVSLDICKTKLRKRYQLVWDSYFWRDSQAVNLVSLSAHANTFNLPSGMERLVTIGNSDGVFLDPVDGSFIIEAAPGTLASDGTPQYYTESLRTVTVFPSPDQPIDLSLFGKKVCPGFVSDDDTSVLRNCDNAIIAFAHADMLERMRQRGSAQAKFQEANALLEEAKSVERDQANRPRRNKNLTVAGNSLAEMTDAVCGICGQWTPDIRILVKEFLRRNYVALYQLQLWPESTVVVRVAQVGEQIILPHFVDRVVAARTADGFRLMPNNVEYLFAVDPTVFEQTGTPLSMSILTPVAVGALPIDPEAFLIASSAPEDAGKHVFIRGESGGTEVTEEVILATPATTPVQTVYSYDVPITISKPITHGDVTVNGAVSLGLYQFLAAGERERKHQRLWLLPAPATPAAPVECEQGCLVLGKRKITPLRTDEDTPIITGAQGVLIAGAAADLYSRLGNADLSNKFSARADAMSKALISENIDQSAYSPKIVPVVEPSYVLANEGYCWSKV